MEEKNIILYDETSNIPQEEFKLAHEESNIHDTKFETRPVGWLEDSFKRFCKNKASVVGAIIIFIIALFAIIAPIASPWAKDEKFYDTNLALALPKLFESKTGFWDGTERRSIGELEYKLNTYSDANDPFFDAKTVKKVEKPGIQMIPDPDGKDINGDGKFDPDTDLVAKDVINVTYSVQWDSYALGIVRVKLDNEEEYQKLLDYEKEQNISYSDENRNKSIIKPYVDYYTYINYDLPDYLENELHLGFGLVNTICDQMNNFYNQHPNIYYKLVPSYDETNSTYSSNRFEPYIDAEGKIEELYIKDSEDNLVMYDDITGSIEVRVDYTDYFKYKYGFTPKFLFGSNVEGKDICFRLAKGARFSLLLGVGISFINFIIGLIWGAVSGYYGGTADLVMERITDIISNIPTIIIMTITSIQLNNNGAVSGALGPAGTIVVAILISFVYNGWVGVASTTRMQFYRFKGQEYVLASRTLGAKDRRLIFKHILPNAVGTLVTSSVLMIPGVIFSESSLSYLGIIDFRTSGIYSVGALLNEGQAKLQSSPHMILFPAIIISLLMISFNLFGNGLRDAFNTTLRGSED